MEPIKKILRTPTALVIVLAAIITAILTFLGVIIKNKSDEKIANIPIEATLTAEAKLTAQISPPADLSTPDISTPTTQKNILETIQFDYVDSPLNHGWNFIEGTPYPTFEPVNDGSVGRALKITTPDDNFYAIDYELRPSTKAFGNFVEFVASYPDAKSSLYAFVELTNNHGETSYGWLRFMVGKEKVLPSQKITDEQEWLVYLYPESFLDQNWVKLQVDLSKIVQETYGKDGWLFQKIIKFRIRGNLWIDSIEISEIKAQ